MSNQSKPIQRARKGLALLAVLIMIMAITILSLGYIARSDIDLAAGQNMSVRLQLDQLATSGLEHARGLILNPQDIAGAYWTGDNRLQLDASSQNFYDVNVVQDPNDYCNYTITSSAYRLDDANQIGLSRLSAVLRLDPCVAFWVGDTSIIPSTFTIKGDVYCNGTLTNQGFIDGDTFSNLFSGSSTGSNKSRDDLLSMLSGPEVDESYSHPDYSTMSIGPGVVSDSTCTPAAIYSCSGDLTLGSNVAIEGMLLVDGDLTIRGNGNNIVAAKNLPALYVSGDLTIDDVNGLSIEGLAMVEGDVWVGADASNVQVVGGLFLDSSPRQTVPDSSGHNHDLRMYGEPTWRSTGGYSDGALEFDGTNDYLQDLNAESYLNGLWALTISLWVKSDVINVDRGIFYTRDPSASTADRYLGLRYDQTGAYGHQSSCIKASIRTGFGPWAESTQIESSGDVQTTSWQHLVLTWNTGESLKLYINGSYDYPPSHDGGAILGWTGSADKLILGKGAYGNLWDGCMDEVRIYNWALSLSDIQQLYVNPTAGTTIGLIAHYTMDEDGPGVSVVANPAVASIETADEERWSPAAGAFFKTIER